MPANTNHLLALMTTAGPQGAMLIALVWFGRRFLAQNDRLIGSIERAIDELRASREAMDDARTAFERRRVPEDREQGAEV